MIDNLAAGRMPGRVINGAEWTSGSVGAELKPGPMPFSWARFIGFRTKRIASTTGRTNRARMSTTTCAASHGFVLNKHAYLQHHCSIADNRRRAVFRISRILGPPRPEQCNVTAVVVTGFECFSPFAVIQCLGRSKQSEINHHWLHAEKNYSNSRNFRIFFSFCFRSNGW